MKIVLHTCVSNGKIIEEIGHNYMPHGGDERFRNFDLWKRFCLCGTGDNWGKYYCLVEIKNILIEECRKKSKSLKSYLLIF